MLALPRSSGMVDLIFIAFGGDLKGHTARVSRGVLAAAWIWALNLSIQPVQAGIRAFIIDSCPPEQQVQASAYSSCVTNLGGIVGYASGLIVLPRVAPWLGGTQFQALCLIASIALGSTVFVSCLTIKEQAVMMEDDAGGAKPNIKLIFRQLSKTSGALPERIKQVCMVQFFAWIGWFPFLFYITSYIGDLCKLSRPTLLCI